MQRSPRRHAPPMAQSVPQLPLVDMVLYSFQALVLLSLLLVLAIPFAVYHLSGACSSRSVRA